MPIHDRYAHGDVLFARAIAECIVRHRNNAPGVDPDTGNVDGGICSGITSTWLIHVLNADRIPDAVDPQRFGGHFDLLRFQGAYLKELHGQADTHLERLEKAVDIGAEPAGVTEARPLPASALPDLPWWAAYVGMKGHAIGIGLHAGRHAIMDPNFGLFVYDDAAAFLADLNQLVESYMSARNKPGDARFLFFRRSA